MTNKIILESFPDTCLLDNPEVNCIRVDTVKDKCIGAVNNDIVIVYEGVNSREVGKVLTQCTADVSLQSKHIYKIEAVPGCRAGVSLDGTDSCIQYA